MEQQIQLDPSKLSASDKKELQQILANEAQKTNIQQSNNFPYLTRLLPAVHHLTDVCWKKCVPGKVSGGALDKNELSCAQNCVNRWMDANLSVMKHLETLRGSQ
ncbi:Mitochondrial import inner membrane translocase subunit tim8 [Microsporum ferrugineum]